MSPSQSDYTAPTSAEIATTQNSVPALRLLIGQRKLYSRAKFWSFLRWLGFSAIGVAGPLVAVLFPPAAVIVSAIVGAWIYLSRTVFESLESAWAAKGAAAQEDFDQLVFGMAPLGPREPRPSPEEIAHVVGPAENVVATATKENLYGWYPVDPELDGTASIAIAQRANAAYSERLQYLNAHCWLAAVGVWALVAVVMSLAFNVDLPTFLLGVAVPLLPAFLDVTDQWRLARQASADRRAMADDIEGAIRGTRDRPLADEDLLIWQERLYGLRRSSPLVPNLVYKRVRNQNEQAMNEAAAELSSVAKQRHAGGP